MSIHLDCFSMAGEQNDLDWPKPCWKWACSLILMGHPGYRALADEFLLQLLKESQPPAVWYLFAKAALISASSAQVCAWQPVALKGGRACLGATELQAHVAICWPLWGGGNILKPLQPPLCEPTFHGPFSPRDADLGHSCSTGCFVFISSVGITSAKERWKGVWWPVEQMLCGPLCTKSPSLSSFSLNRITKIIPLSELTMLCQMGPWQYFSSWYPKLILAIRVGPLWGGPSSHRLKSLSDWEEQRQKRVKKQGQSLQCDISRFDSTLVKK